MSFWSRDYVAAVASFHLALERLEGSGFEVSHRRLLIDQIGPQEENLAIDVALIGPKHASRWVMVSSGVHGVEGFAGSAIQLSILAQLQTLPDDTALALIHIVNPYGMAWLRRVNESNVDLNRNMLLPGEEYSGEPDGYAALSPLINEQVEPKNKDGFLRRAMLFVAKNGFANTKQAFAEGQYERPQCLQYGGSELEVGSALLLEWLGDNLRTVKRCVWIDLHTGLGKAGIDTLLVEFAHNDPILSRLRAHYGKRITSLDPEAGIAYKIRGGLQAGVEARFPDIEWTSITQEFGTVGPYAVIAALRSENQWTQWGRKSGREALNHWSRDKLLATFNLKKPKWEEKLIIRGRKLFADALADLQGEQTR
jgi:hypothetical protein